ncbi:MAG: hypothetical protein PUB22_05915 [Clostridiales bacterium]|nr:hypothetical protein [Clostridiales bacterium]
MISESEYTGYQLGYSAGEARRNAYAKIKTQYEYVRTSNSEGKSALLIPQWSYRYLLGEYGWKKVSDRDFLTILLLIMLVIPLWNADRQRSVYAIHRVSSVGIRTMIRKKQRICLGIAMVFTVLISSINLLEVWYRFGLSYLAAPICSIPEWSFLPWNCSIGTAYLISIFDQYFTPRYCLLHDNNRRIIAGRMYGRKSRISSKHYTMLRNKDIVQFGDYSHSLAQALLGNPGILILDEPTAGLDPEERIHTRNMIAELAGERIIILATHIVSDVECIADQVILMKKGRIVRCGTPEELIHSMTGHVGECHCSMTELRGLQSHYPNGTLYQREDGLYFRIVTDALPDSFRAVTMGIGLEEVYLYYAADREQSKQYRS